MLLSAVSSPPFVCSFRNYYNLQITCLLFTGAVIIFFNRSTPNGQSREKRKRKDNALFIVFSLARRGSLHRSLRAMLVKDEVFGFIVLVFSLACLGTWPALLRLGSFQNLNPSKSETQLLLPPFDEIGCQCFATRDKPRNICHVYLDYSFAYVVVSSIPYLVSFFAEESRGNGEHPIIPIAMLGGALLSIGNLSFQWATAVFGAPLTTVLSLQASLTVVLGTSINYWIDPSFTSRPDMLFGGVVVFLVAICFAALAQMKYARERDAEIRRAGEEYQGTDLEEVESNYTSSAAGHGRLDSVDDSDKEVTANRPFRIIFNRKANSFDSFNANSYQLHLSTMNANPLDSLSSSSSSISGRGVNKQTSVGDGKEAVWAVVVAIGGGICYGFFSPAFNIAVNDPFQWTNNNRGSDKLDLNQDLLVVEANFWFSLAFWLASIVGNGILMWRQRLAIQSRVNFFDVIRIWTAYFCQDSWIDRQLAFSAGVICAMGNVLQFKGGQLVGYSTSDMVQAYPVVSTLWDVFVFGEFHDVKFRSRVAWLLIGMHAAYLSGVLLLAGSSVVT